MAEPWIKRQLTEAKKKAPMWAYLADAINDIFNSQVEPFLDRLKTRTSLFEEGREELEIELRELGSFFAIGDVEDEDLPVVIMQRQDQVHQKKTIYPLVSTINREFNGMGVTWEPLYAPIDQEAYPYGDLLATKDDVDDSQHLKPEDFFLTSRGVIRVPMNQIRAVSNSGIDEEELGEFEATLRRVIYPLIPLRIVCDGQQYYIYFEFEEKEETIDITKIEFEFGKVAIIKEIDEHLLCLDSEISNSQCISEGLRAPNFNQSQVRMDAVRMDSLRLDRTYYTNNVDPNVDSLRFSSAIDVEDDISNLNSNNFEFNANTVDISDELDSKVKLNELSLPINVNDDAMNKCNLLIDSERFSLKENMENIKSVDSVTATVPKITEQNESIQGRSSITEITVKDAEAQQCLSSIKSQMSVVDNTNDEPEKISEHIKHTFNKKVFNLDNILRPEITKQGVLRMDAYRIDSIRIDMDRSNAD